MGNKTELVKSTEEAKKLGVRLIKVESTADTFYLDTYRLVLQDLGKKQGYLPEQLSEIELAVDEVCTNVVEHSYPKNEKFDFPINREYDKKFGNELSVIFEVSEEIFMVTIINRGKDFDIKTYDASKLEDKLGKLEKGIGINVIKKLVGEDDILYKHVPKEGNKVILYSKKKKDTSQLTPYPVT